MSGNNMIKFEWIPAEELEEFGIDPSTVTDEMRVYYGEFDTVEHFEDRYLGEYYGGTEYDAAADWRYELAEDCGELDEIPSQFEPYIDWLGMGRDLILGGEIAAIEVDWGRWFLYRTY